MKACSGVSLRHELRLAPSLLIGSGDVKGLKQIPDGSTAAVKQQTVMTRKLQHSHQELKPTPLQVSTTNLITI